MAELDIHYTVAYRNYGGEHLGRDVHLIVTYDENHPYTGATQNPGPAYLVTSVTGTYSVINGAGNVIRTDTITGLAPAGGNIHSDNLLYDGSGYEPRVDDAGIGFTTSNQADYNNPGDSGNAFSGHASHGSNNYFEYPDTLDGARVTFTLLCFVTGTKIRTTTGDVAIESLKIGDIAITASGRRRPIRWLGRRFVDFRPPSADEGHFPVRIVAGALGPARPAADLLVSPGHRFMFRCNGRDVLVPASSLINGSTIRTEAVSDVVYWHVELETHDLLLANGTAAESYQDLGNRAFFSGAEPVSTGSPAVRACLPTVTDPCALRPVLTALRERALELGWRLDHLEPNPQLIVDGEAQLPLAREGSVFRFGVPSAAREIILGSSVSTPCGVEESLDARQLGLRVRTITLVNEGGLERELDQTYFAQCDGFYDGEGSGATRSRWTNGRACIARQDGANIDGAVILKLELAPHQLLSWVPPVE